MAEMIWWCEVHGYQSFDGEDGSSCEDGVWLEGSGGWNCREVVRNLSAPGELIDPANLDYEAARDAMVKAHPPFKPPYWGIDVLARVAVDAALGVGEPVEGNG